MLFWTTGCDWVGESIQLRPQVNRIRQSLQVMAANSSTFGLRQPHLQRTRLCELPDSELDPGYVRQRGQLHDLVQQLAKPKVLQPPHLSSI